MTEKILVTGSAGFIGFHVCKKLLSRNYEVIGIDNVNNYYDINLKKSRLQVLDKYSSKNKNSWIFCKGSLEDSSFLNNIFKKYSPSIVINLAAQAGVRYSITNPKSYIDSNIVGFSNILEFCRSKKVKHLIYASSSSVYGGNTKLPFSENDPVNHPVSLYAATKKANELLAHSYSNLYNIPATGLRFFTVYGPWGRPDMAPMIFAKSIYEDIPLKIFNKGKMQRDFTYIEDVVEAIFKLIKKPAISDINFKTNNPNPSTSWAPHRILNIGNNETIELLDFIEILERLIGRKANKNYLPMQKGDVVKTWADTNLMESYIGFKPYTNIEDGLVKFVNWYKEYYGY